MRHLNFHLVRCVWFFAVICMNAYLLVREIRHG